MYEPTIELWTHRCFCGELLGVQNVSAVIHVGGLDDKEVYVGARLFCPKWDEKHGGPQVTVDLVGDYVERNYAIDCSTGAVYALTLEEADAIRAKAELAPMFEGPCDPRKE